MKEIGRTYVGQNPQVMKGPEGPGPSSILNRLDVVVDPPVRHGSRFVRNLELLDNLLELHCVGALTSTAVAL